MLVSDLVAQVRVSLGDSGGVYAKDDMVVAWINEAIRDIFRKTNLGRDKHFTHTLTAGTSQYTDTDEIHKIHYIAREGVKLEEKLYASILDEYGWEFVNTPGLPRFFWKGYESGLFTINFAPTPSVNVDLSMSLTYLPDTLTSSDDTTDVVPSSYVDDIIRFAVMRGHERGKDFRASEKAESQYEANLAERADEANRFGDEFFTISADPLDYI